MFIKLLAILFIIKKLLLIIKKTKLDENRFYLQTKTPIRDYTREFKIALIILATFRFFQKQKEMMGNVLPYYSQWICFENIWA